MLTIIYIFVGFVFLVILSGVLWQYSKKFPCPSWLGWMVEMDNPFTKTNRANVIIEHLALKPGMYVLDAGCGPGRLAIPIALKLMQAGGVTAMDLQSNMLSKVREKAQAKGLQNIIYLNAALGEGRLEKNKYDRVLLVTVLGEIPDKKASLIEIFNSLKHGGILSVTEVIFDPHFQNRKTVRTLASNTGFVETRFIGNRIAFTIHFQKP